MITLLIDLLVFCTQNAAAGGSDREKIMKDGFYKTENGVPYEVYNNQILVEHENGYYGLLYGKSSMSIFQESREVLHTGKRIINSADELYEQLAKMPEFMRATEQIYADDSGEK